MAQSSGLGEGGREGPEMESGNGQRERPTGNCSWDRGIANRKNGSGNGERRIKSQDNRG